MSCHPRFPGPRDWKSMDKQGDEGEKGVTKSARACGPQVYGF
ncbi:conserved hypothetical protein [delta proteobacterium NaphS2]|nr:conserved hypothetical protein [delta proteobacterium NaphS2]